ncbi:hypothetical protein OVS_03615 [Mycoplasma ovis str. Michigan]|uniref:Uncharacterized protein n=1 Tax=Mycoplasma ovis str. Michigan TaxID=1415773 RepID=A0ABN4BN95_9MOLU|nr:hypothetical protein OVS_03615 [Mycoplasma ovis str. Michigan]
MEAELSDQGVMVISCKFSHFFPSNSGTEDEEKEKLIVWLVKGQVQLNDICPSS